MFERFSGAARRAIVLAQEEARTLSHRQIGTEHLLLGLIQVTVGDAAHALAAAGVSLPVVRARVAHTAGRGRHAPARRLPFTRRARNVVEGSSREAAALGDVTVGTEHLLLSLIGEGGGAAARLLVGIGVDLDELRTSVTHGRNARRSSTVVRP